MSHIINNGRLTVEFADINAPFHKYRFDRAGFMNRVVLDGDICFTAGEPRNLPHPSSAGCGFCYVNKLRSSEDVAVGEYIPILGIGLIRRPDEKKISQFNRYDEGFIPFEIKETFEGNKALYEVLPMECNGFSVHEYKNIIVNDTSIRVEGKLVNCGQKDLTIMEYGHNFVSIDGMAVGPDYKIDMPQIDDMTGVDMPEAERGGEGNFVGEGKGFRMKKYEYRDFSMALENYDFYNGQPFVWRITNEAAGAFVEGKEEIALSRVKVWSCDHMVCPEIYQNFVVKPGETYSWARTLTFGTTR